MLDKVIISTDGKRAVIHLDNKSVQLSCDEGCIIYLVDYVLGCKGDLYLWKLEATQEIDLDRIDNAS